MQFKPKQKLAGKISFAIPLLAIGVLGAGNRINAAYLENASTPPDNSASHAREERRDRRDALRAKNQLSMDRIKTSCTIAFKYKNDELVPSFALNRGEVYYRIDGSTPDKLEQFCAINGDSAEYIGAANTTWVDFGLISGNENFKSYQSNYNEKLESIGYVKEQEIPQTTD